jgi:hypothetical protein
MISVNLHHLQEKNLYTTVEFKNMIVGRGSHKETKDTKKQRMGLILVRFVSFVSLRETFPFPVLAEKHKSLITSDDLGKPFLWLFFSADYADKIDVIKFICAICGKCIQNLEF